jgi:hypothetical protein
VSPTPQPQSAEKPLAQTIPYSPSASAILMWKAVLGLGTLFTAIAWAIVLGHVAGHHEGTAARESFGYLTAGLLLELFTLLLIFVGGSYTGFWLGKDGRISTSKFQIILWTYAIGGVMMAIVAQSWAGLDDGLNAIGSGFKFEPYLVLLGGPFLAAIAASGLLGSQVGSGQTAKPPGKPEANQLFSGDDGNTDLVDSQYLLFNLIAVLYFLGAYIGKPTGGLPEIPTFIYVLTGASALAYVSNKVMPTGAPTINSIVPATVKANKVGQTITIYGSQILFPLNPTSNSIGTSLDDYQGLRILVNGIPATPTAVNSSAGVDEIKIELNQTQIEAAGEEKVVAINFRGVESNSVDLKIE